MIPYLTPTNILIELKNLNAEVVLLEATIKKTFDNNSAPLTLTLSPHGAREPVVLFPIFPRHHEVGERVRVRGLNGYKL